jgi:signal peptidase I
MSKHKKPEGFAAIVYEYTKVILGALILAATVRSLWFEPFKIPSTSMVPTLLVGDYLFVDKNNYGWRNPCTGTRYNGQEIQKGDVVVFEKKKGYLCGLTLGFGSLNFIKRIVAVPGDKISYNNKTLYVNGEAIHMSVDGTHVYEDALGQSYEVKKYDVSFNGLTHEVLLDEERRGFDLEEVTVPEGQYVVMGDNRDNSLDSRFWQYPDWGFVKKEDIVGQAKMLFWSWNSHFNPRFERIGHSLVAETEKGQ